MRMGPHTPEAEPQPQPRLAPAEEGLCSCCALLWSNLHTLTGCW